jgi:phosphoribosylformimino-5-aminoimidazole carboxamide ribotide isomerase
VYGDDPVVMAKKWASEGASRLHIVDLDGAFGEGSANLEAVFRIKESVRALIQFGGGLRDFESLRQVMSKGVGRAILGTVLLEEPAWIKDAVKEFDGRLMAGVDARDGEVMGKGWRAGSGKSVPEVVKKIEGWGFKELIYTDIRRDGTLQGPNIDGLRTVMKSTRMGVYASGGVSRLEDIRSLKALEPEGLKGCVVGKALYAGKFTLAEAIAAARL